MAGTSLRRDGLGALRRCPAHRFGGLDVLVLDPLALPGRLAWHPGLSADGVVIYVIRRGGELMSDNFNNYYIKSLTLWDTLYNFYPTQGGRHDI